MTTRAKEKLSRSFDDGFEAIDQDVLIGTNIGHFELKQELDPDLIHDSVNPTASMLRLMTPDYASPEQIRGDEVTHSSDVYSLGVLFYELLSGHRPFNLSGKALHEITYAIWEEEPLPPSH